MGQDPPTRAWRVEYDAGFDEFGGRIALDDEGNLLIAANEFRGQNNGITKFPFVRKLAPDGSLLWHAPIPFDILGQSNAHVQYIVTSPQGGYYIAIADPFLRTKASVHHYDSDGNHLAVHRFEGERRGQLLALDGQGRPTYLACRSEDEVCVTSRFSPDLSSLSEVSTALEFSQVDSGGTSAALLAQGGLMFAWSIFRPEHEHFNIQLVRIAENGTITWEREYDSGGDDMFRSLAVDGRGRTYLVMSSDVPGEPRRLNQIVRYDASGTRDWEDSSSTFMDHWQVSESIVRIDAWDNVYLFGSRFLSRPGMRPTGHCTIRRYDPDGRQEWLHLAPQDNMKPDLGIWDAIIANDSDIFTATHSQDSEDVDIHFSHFDRR